MGMPHTIRGCTSQEENRRKCPYESDVPRGFWWAQGLKHTGRECSLKAGEAVKCLFDRKLRIIDGDISEAQKQTAAELVDGERLTAIIIVIIGA